MLKIYITTVSQTAGLPVHERLSDYRTAKTRRFHGEENAAAGFLLDYALRSFGLFEHGMQYGENSHGKPFFTNRADIHFNLSHSSGYAVCAVSDSEVGVDAEARGDTKDILKIARRYFTASEYEHIKNSGDTKTAFCRLWTRKESLLKLLGTGISGRLSEYEVLRDHIIIGDTKFYFSQIDGYPDISITVCSPELVKKAEFVTADMFNAI